TDYESDRSQLKGLAPQHVYDAGQKTLAGYYQQTVRVFSGTDLSAGGRVQWNETTARGSLDPTAPGSPNPSIQALPLDDSEVNQAWHLGAEQQVGLGVTLFGRLAQSFRIANIDERVAIT